MGVLNHQGLLVLLKKIANTRRDNGHALLLEKMDRPGRKLFPKALKNLFDESLSQAVEEVIRRPEFRRVPPEPGTGRFVRRYVLPIAKTLWKNLWKSDPKTVRANVERFIRMLRRFSERTQFVVITHNKQTMEAANCLYGVTMQELGVSKLVSVRFDGREEGRAGGRESRPELSEVGAQ